MNILQFQQTEMRATIREMLTKDRGIPVERLTEPESVTLYTYVRPSNGQRVWLIERQIYCSPDAVLFRTWIVDELPSSEQMFALAHQPKKE